MSNPYYTPSGVPPTQTRGVSASMRNEFDSVATGFDDVYAEILALAAAVGISVSVSEVPVASASTTDIGNNYGPVIRITGTTTITSFGANYKGAIFIRFAGALTLTHSSSLVLPGAANITTVAGDACIAVPIGDPASGWRVMAYCRMSQGLIDDIAVKTSSTYADPSWLTALAWSKITGKPTTIAGYGITDAPTKTGSGASGDWSINITGWAKSFGAAADIASAATLVLTSRTGNLVPVTGTTTVTAITLNNGDLVLLEAVDALPINVAGVLTYTCTAGDNILVWQDGNGTQGAFVLKRFTASTTQSGEVELATDAEFATGTSTTLVPPVSAIRAGQIVLNEAEATTSGTSKTSPAIPSWANRVKAKFVGFSTNGSSFPLLQAIVAGSPVTSGYTGTCNFDGGGGNTLSLLSGGVLLAAAWSAGSIISGDVVFERLEPGSNTWLFSGELGFSNAVGLTKVSGHISLAGAMEAMRLTTVGGTDAMDAGSLAFSWGA